MKINHYRSVLQADTSAVMLAARGIVGLLTTVHRPLAPKAFVMFKCIFMNNAYFHFTLLWFWI